MDIWGRIICTNKERLTFLKAAKVFGIREQDSAVAESHRKILQLIACEEKNNLLIIFVLEKREFVKWMSTYSQSTDMKTIKQERT